MLRILSLIVFLLVLVTGLAFTVLNAEPVQLNYYFGTRFVPLSLTLVGALIAGVVLGIAAGLGMVLRLKREIARLRKTVKVTEREVLNLRSIPIKDIH
jgi:lipopolysaccharide assembly protein A